MAGYRILSVLRRKSAVYPQAGLLAWRGNCLPDRFTFPGSKEPSGVLQTANPHLQWRDRAGISPDFPIKLSRAPEEIRG